MNSNICQDTLVGIPEYFQKHQHLLLSIVELTIFYIAKVRFSRILSHPCWYKSHFFDQRKDEFENLSQYTCWHTRVLSKTPAPVALHRRAYHILHCKGAIFPNIEPSLSKVIFWPEKRWLRNSVTIHLLAYQSTFKNTSTCCSPSKSLPYFTLQMCDFPEIWPIPFDTKVILLTREKMNSKFCQDTLVGLPEYLQKHQHLSLSIVELTIFYIANARFSWNLTHPFWYKSHFIDQRKDEFEILSRYTCWHTRVPSKAPAPVALHRRASHILHCKGAIFPNFEPSLSKVIFLTREKMNSKICQYTCWHTRVLSKTPAPVALHRRAYHILHCKGAIFPNFEPSLSKVIFWPEKRWIRNSVTIHLLAYQSTFKNTSTCCSPSKSLPYFTLQMCDFPEIWPIPFDTKVILLTREKMNSKICQDTLVGIPEYPQKHQHRLLSIVELPIFYIAKVRFSRILSHPFWYKSHFFDQRKDWIRKSVTVHLLAYQSTYKNTSTCCSPS